MAHSNHSPQAPEQLALLSPGELPVQFLLDQRTRQRGLAHVAAIKAQLAALHAEPAPASPAVVAPARRAA
jgi:hypothetical protein